MLPKLEWIAQRTSFLDSTLDAWIDGLKASGGSPAEAQVVLLGAGRRHAPRREIAPADPSLRRGAGAGYDTRALRYSGDQAPAFYEVDLPVVTRAKGVLSSRYAAATGVRQPAMLPLDLMTCASGAHTLTAPSSLPQPPLCCHSPLSAATDLSAKLLSLGRLPVGAPALEALAPLGLDRSRPSSSSPSSRDGPALSPSRWRLMRLPTPRPTLVVFEAVLFYLSPPAKAALLREAAALLAEGRRDAPRCTREMYRDLAEMPLAPHTRHVHDTSTDYPRRRPPSLGASPHRQPGALPPLRRPQGR